MHFVALTACLVLAAPVTFLQAVAQERTDVELVLLADASGSIDDAEILFQRQGYADAITDPQILSVIRSGAYGKIALTYVEWGSTESQEVVVPWTVIGDEASAKAFAKRLMAEPRRAFGRNAIGNAIAFAQALIETNDVEGFRKVIDLSADSANNWGGIPIEIARQKAIDAGIIINGLYFAYHIQALYAWQFVVEKSDVWCFCLENIQALFTGKSVASCSRTSWLTFRRGE